MKAGPASIESKRFSVAKRFPLRLKIVTGVHKDNDGGLGLCRPPIVIEDVHPLDIQYTADGIECGLT